MDVAGRIAVVTGAAYGMGRELTRLLAAAGCHVAACDVNGERLEETKELSAKDGIRVSTHVVDVSSEQDQQRFAEEVRQQHQTDHVHLLINNAGVGGGGSMLVNSRAEWERTFAIDWGGVYLGVRTFLPMLVAADEAKIVNTSSVNGFWGSVGPNTPHTAYTAAKFAVKGFTEALMTDLRLNAPHVTAAVVMPGHIGTGIVANSRRAMTGDASDTLTEQELEAIRARMSASGLDVERLTDEDLHGIIADRAREFEEKAPTTAAEAAEIILDGIRKDRWRILVGLDAEKIDKLVREDPENAYTPEFFQKVADEVGWNLGLDPRD